MPGRPFMKCLGCGMMALALFLVVGGHWAMLQGVAWVAMVHDFSRCETLSEAVGKTLDGRHPCPLCKKITKAHSSEERAPVTVKVDKKAEVFVASSGSELPARVCHPLIYWPGPFVETPEPCFAPPVPVPISA